MMTPLKMLLSVAFATTALAGFAQSKAPVFTTIKANAITSVKDQNRSGTCWDYATCGFLESEILRKTGKTVDLAEMYVAYQDYLDCADYHIRMHGSSRFSEGGSCDDVVSVIKRFGIVPEEAMTRPGAMVGDSLANFNEFFPALEAYVNNYADSKQTSITTQWRQGMTGILDAYLGTYQKEFSYGGKRYTPQSFAASLGLDWDDYVSVTSYTHHPFNKWMVIEAPYKWRPRPSFNIPLDQMMTVIDNALAHGYCVAWGGDVSGDNFSRSGIGLALDKQKAYSLAGSDAERWLKLPKAQQKSKLDSLGVDAPEVTPTQALRQKYFDTWESTYDHVMLIFGTAKDKNGKEYYMVKNSWGDYGNYHGIWYLSKSFVAMYTTYIFLNKHALDKRLLDKMTVRF
jgi:aminopeptidase C